MDEPARLVFIGAPGSGKSTVVNSVVASWLDATRASARASLLPSVVERETLTRSRPRAETSTMEARVREEFSDACLSPDGRRALAAIVRAYRHAMARLGEPVLRLVLFGLERVRVEVEHLQVWVEDVHQEDGGKA